MDKYKLQKILEFNKNNQKEIQSACSEFYQCIDRQYPIVISDIQTLAELIFNKYNYKFLHIPMKSKEIGAFQLRLNNASYVVLNTSKNLAYNNFSIAHELYHVLIQNHFSKRNSAELYLNKYEENKDEMMANAFAGNILMPIEDFKLISTLILNGSSSVKLEPYINELYVITSLMNYYKTTYMSVVIRCYELNIFDVNNEKLMDILLLNNSEEQQRELCRSIGKRKDVSIMESTKEDDFQKLYEEAKHIGEKKVQDGLVTEEDMIYRLEGMKKAYLSIREVE